MDLHAPLDVHARILDLCSLSGCCLELDFRPGSSDQSLPKTDCGGNFQLDESWPKAGVCVALRLN